MDADNDGAYEAVPLTCFACAARDGEERKAAQARQDGSYGSTAFDGLMLSIVRRDTHG